jgi:hypothetical protein
MQSRSIRAGHGLVEVQSVSLYVKVLTVATFSILLFAGESTGPTLSRYLPEGAKLERAPVWTHLAAGTPPAGSAVLLVS